MSGGGGAGATGGAGGAGGTGGGCAGNEKVVNGECVAPFVVSMSVTDQTLNYDVIPEPGHFGIAGACGSIAAATTVTELGSEGPCQVIEVTGGSQNMPFDVGEVKFTGDKIGDVVLAPPEGDMKPCYGAELMIPPFEVGDNIHFSLAGGQGVPATDIDVLAPDTLSLSANALTAGQPYTFGWSPGGQLAVAISANGGDRSIQCQFDAGSSHTVPASLTALLADEIAAATELGVYGFRLSSVTIDPENEPYRVRATVLSSYLRIITQ